MSNLSYASLMLFCLLVAGAHAGCDLVSVAYQATSATEVAVGETVTYNVVVTNNAGCPLNNVVLQDDSGCGAVPSSVSLATGETRSFACSTVVTQAGVVGGQVTATVQETEQSSFTVGIRANPAIDIRKNAKGNTDTQTVRCGGDSTITWIIAVTNVGDTDLTDVRVSDPLAPTCDRTFPFLARGQRQLYLCRLLNVNQGFTNRACATGTPPSGGAPVQDCDENIVNIVCPQLSVSKTPDTQVLNTGEDAVFTITVGNSGDVVLTDVQVTDALTPSCDRTFASIFPGQAQTYQCTASNVPNTFTNTACATAGAPAGPRLAPVCDSAVVSTAVPSISIRKNVQGPDSQTVRAGGEVSWVIVVTNDGDANLQNVQVADPNAPDCTRSFGFMAAGTTQTYTCSFLNVQNSFPTLATASGNAGSSFVTASDPSDVVVIRPSLSISKDPATQTISAPGGTATFTIVVTNTGDVALTNVRVSDVNEPSCVRTFGNLGVGQSTSYSCSTANVQAGFVNTACATASAPAGNDLAPTCDSATVDLAFADLFVRKQAPGSDTRTFRIGSDVSFEVEVRNSGTLTLTNVVVLDPRTASCERTIGTLVAGQTVVFSCSALDVQESFNNFLRVNADSPTGPITRSDTSDVNIIVPAVTITSNADGVDSLFVDAGGSATFIITVRNAGDVPLTNVAVTNPQVPGCDRFFADLGPSMSQSYSCSFNNVQLSFVSTIQACAQVPIDGGPNVCDLDQTRVVRVDEVCQGPANPSVLLFDFSDSTGGITSVYVEVFHANSPTTPIVTQTLAQGQTFSVSLGGASLAPSFTIRTWASPRKQTQIGSVVVPVDCAAVPPTPKVADLFTSSGSGFTATYTLLGENKK